ncbi:MAG: hypothetical protein HOW73_08910 [Polyangiaceae bacterium]|nr:hypothetical protein [Polyangiaceae bacterium]
MGLRACPHRQRAAPSSLNLVVRRSERIAALEALLARIQSNARERRRELGLLDVRRAEDERSAASGDDLPTSLAARGLPRPGAETAPTREEMDWTSLLASDLAEPKPLESAVQVANETSLVAELEAAAPETHTPIEQRAAAVIDSERPPRSVLERALQRAAERRTSLPDPRELWEEAAGELRERKPSTIPPAVPPPVIAGHVELEPEAKPSGAGHVERSETGRGGSYEARFAEGERGKTEPVFADELPASVLEVPDLDAAPVSTRSLPPHAEPAALPQEEAIEQSEPPTPREDLERMDAVFARASGSHRAADRRRFYVVLTMFGFALLAAVYAVVTRRRPEPETETPTAIVTTAGPTAETPPRSGVRSSLVPPTSTVATGEPPATESPSTTAESGPIPPIRDPKDNGLLWVETKMPADVYVRGIRVGKSGEYIELPCGMRHVRLAKPGAPPPGDSFPAWIGEGKAVFVPCGEAHRTTL